MFTFIDLFCGIGGFHLALQGLGGVCVYACDIDKDAQRVYQANFPETTNFKGDITLEENTATIPENADILCAGFPCQPFSVIGKILGQKDLRGRLLYDVFRILIDKKPKIVMLENVPNILNDHKTMEYIAASMANAGYVSHQELLKACDYGLPTHRKRLYIVAIRKDMAGSDTFTYPEPIPLVMTMSDVFGGECEKKIGYTLRVGGRRSGIKDKHNWDAYMVDGKVKFIGVKEARMMMGFPDTFVFPETSERKALKLLGNSVAVNVIREIAKRIII